MGITAWPVSTAVGIQGASCCSCQNGLQVVCQLLHCGGVTGHAAGNIDQSALLGRQVGAENCMPRQPAVYARWSEKCVVLQPARTGNGQTQRRWRTVSGYRTKIPTNRT